MAWLAYFRLEPTAAELHQQAQDAADLRHAEAMALFANAHRDRRRRPAPFRVTDFLPRRPGDEQPAIDEGEALLAKITAANAALGGTVKVH